MKWLVCIAFATICGSCIGEQNAEFRERAEIYSRLIDCDYYKTTEYNYTQFVNLNDVKDAQPTGYFARVPVYVIGARDGHIVLSKTNTPNRDTDFAYEFLFGGYGNTRIVIRKRIQNYPLKELILSEIISELRPLKVLIEVAKNGHIKVFTDNKAEPIIEAFDPFVLPVQYLSFASYQGSPNEYLYNCNSDKTTIDTSNDIQKQPVAVPTNDLSRVSLDTLVTKCQTEETWELQYNKFHELKSLKNSQAENYLFKLNFFIFGGKDVHILLSSTEKPNIETESAYEIVLAGYGGTRQVIRKTVEGDDLFEKLQLKDLISDEQQNRVLIQMNKDGLIEVFVGELQYKAVIKAVDHKPVDVKYVSFASNDGARVLYFYNCDDEKAAASTLPPLPSHALLAGPIDNNEEVLAKKCKHLHAWEDKYTTAIKLESIKNSKPDGFRVQLPFWVKGVRDVQILLTPGTLDPKDGYEIVLGGWGDTKHLIRKNGDVVTKVNEFNVLNEFKPIKVVVELTQAGELRVYTDSNKSKPLLEFKDQHPIDNLSTLSFTAYYRDLDFYFGCTA